MSLTVPTSGNIGGRSASVQIDTPDTGAVISEFGNKMAELGTKWKDEQTDFQTRSTQLSMTSDLADVRLQAEQAGDPVASGQIWDSGSAEVFSKYLPVDANGNSTLDPKQAQDLQLTFQALKGQHTFALAENSANWTRSQASANWIKSRDTILTKTVTADRESFAAYMKVGEDEINALEARGIMDPAAAEIARQALRQDAYKGRADAQIEADPQAYLAADEKGEFDAMGGELRASRRLAATREIARRQAASDLQAKQDLTAHNVALKSRFTEITTIAKAGATAADEDYLDSPDVIAAKDADPAVAAGWGEAKAAIALRNDIPNIHQMSPDQLAAEIIKEKANPKAHDYQAERLKVLTSWHDQAVAKWNSDKVAMAKEVGMKVPELPDFDPADPGNFAKGIAGRISFDSALKDQDYGKGQGILSNEDRAAIKPVLAPKADYNAKLSLLEAVVLGSNGQPDAVLKAMEADPTAIRAARILATTKDRPLAAELLRGQQKIATKTVVMPSDKTMVLTFDDITGGMYNDNPTMKAEMFEASQALYAENASGLDPDQTGSLWSSDPAAVALYSKGVQRLTGATPDENGDLTVGGLQKFNDQFVALPDGISVGSLEQAQALIARQIHGPNDSFNFETDTIKEPERPALDNFRAFKSASVIPNTAPDLGSDPENWWDLAYPRRVGNTDQYELMVPGRAEPLAIAGDARGRVYRFRLADLIRGAQQ